MSSKTKPPPVTRTASCLCGSVQITVTGIDKGAVLCHCANCKKATGSSYAHNHRFTNANLEFKKGEELCKQYGDAATKSGSVLNRHFCVNCGSSLYLTNPSFKGLFIVHSGILDGERAQPFTELFTENKYSWIGEVTQRSKI